MLKIFGALLRVYSYIFHLTLSVFLLVFCVIELFRHEPWFEVRGLALMGMMDLVCTLLGFTRWLRFLFVISAAVVLYQAFNGFFYEPYMPSWLPSGATLAFLGALLVLFKSDANPMPL